MKYLELETLVYDIAKHIMWLVLFLTLAYRMLADVPSDGVLEDWMRFAVLALGWGLMPGIVVRVYTLIHRKSVS